VESVIVYKIRRSVISAVEKNKYIVISAAAKQKELK